MRSHQEDALRRQYGAWRYWRWLGYVRGLWLWTRIRWLGWRGRGGIVRLGPGLYIWPGRQRKLENLTFSASDDVQPKARA